MQKVTRALIEYDGISSFKSDLCAEAIPSSFKQFNIDMELCVPPNKPDMEQVVKVHTTTNVLKQVIIRTPVGRSVEGENLTGYKLLVMGEVLIKIKYVATDVEQSVHTVHANVPFCEYVIMPEQFSNLSAVSSKVYVEDAYIVQRDLKCMFGNITMMLVAQSC